MRKWQPQLTEGTRKPQLCLQNWLLEAKLLALWAGYMLKFAKSFIGIFLKTEIFPSASVFWIRHIFIQASLGSWWSAGASCGKANIWKKLVFVEQQGSIFKHQMLSNGWAKSLKGCILSRTIISWTILLFWLVKTSNENYFTISSLSTGYHRKPF